MAPACVHKDVRRQIAWQEMLRKSGQNVSAALAGLPAAARV